MTSTVNNGTAADGPDQYRLAGPVVPSNYRLHLEPNLVDESFSGSVVITASSTEAVESITLNNDGLEITAATVNGTDAAVSIDAELERMTLDAAAPAGDIEIEIAFTGGFNDQLVGFYLSRFEGGTLATTQFEATHARKAFPCWDEPAFKATFDIEILAPAGTDAVANSSEIGREDVDGGQLIRFATTMKMSTYLVAFVIGPLEITEPVMVDNGDAGTTPLRIVHAPGAGGEDGALTQFALECGAFGLTYFREYFGIPYPGDKVDLIAIPDFAFGAMENLGCITFREALLLVDQTTSTQPELQRVADVIFHELAHMWFGDLVTMSWWNGLWLNEAFATFMEMRCTDAFRPEWDRWTDFGISRTAAYDTDALGSTRPIEFEVASPEDAEGMFDILTYEKGAAVVRMLEQYLGEGRFQAGIRRYMNQHAYGNAETTDLWEAIEAETGDPVRRIMDTWIFQGGFPLVSVAMAADHKSVTFTQERMIYEGGDGGTGSWAIPLRYRWQPVGGEAITESVLLEDETTTVSFDQEAAWLVANADSASFVRVAYDEATSEVLREVAGEALNPVERYTLVDDGWAAMLNGSTSSISTLTLLEAMSTDTDRSVWAGIISGLRGLRRLISGDALDAFEDIAHDTLAPALAGLTLTPVEDEDSRTRQLRGDLIRAMGTIANDPEIQQEAQRTVSVGQRNPELVEASIMSAAIDVAATIGDEADADAYLDAFENAGTPQEQLRFLYALADFPDEEEIERALAMVLDGSVRTQNAPYLVRRALMNVAHGRMVWTFITDNWDHLTEVLPSSSIVRMLEGIASHTHPGDAEAAAAFFESHPVPQGAKTLEQLLERQRVGSALRARESQNLTNFLGG